MSGRLVATATFLLVLGCASPREKAYKTGLRDYRRANQATVEYARAQAKQLATATRTFHASLDRWPTTYNELVSFTIENRLAFDPYAFNDVTFAELPDGSVQIHYDVNCSRFDTPQYKFSQSGSINVTAK